MINTACTSSSLPSSPFSEQHLNAHCFNNQMQDTPRQISAVQALNSGKFDMQLNDKTQFRSLCEIVNSLYTDRPCTANSNGGLFNNQNFTVLVPPKRELELLNEALLGGWMPRKVAIQSILLHVLQGRFSYADLRRRHYSKKDHSYISINGQNIDFVTEDGKKIWVSYRNYATAALEGSNHSSCSGSSNIFQISHLLQGPVSKQILREFREQKLTELQPEANSASTQTDLLLDEDEQHNNRGSDAGQSFTIGIVCSAVLLCVCCTCSLLMLSRRRMARQAHEPSVEASEVLACDTPQVCADGLVPGKLYRLDVLRWSPNPPPGHTRPVMTGGGTKKRNVFVPSCAMTPAPSNQLSVQASYPSTGLDTCGLKKDTACVICYEREGDHVLLPCGHSGYCGACAHTLLAMKHRKRLCPLCRAKLDSVARIDLQTTIGSAGKVLEASVGVSEPVDQISTAGAHDRGQQRPFVERSSQVVAELVRWRREQEEGGRDARSGVVDARARAALAASCMLPATVGQPVLDFTIEI